MRRRGDLTRLAARVERRVKACETTGQVLELVIWWLNACAVFALAERLNRIAHLRALGAAASAFGEADGREVFRRLGSWGGIEEAAGDPGREGRGVAEALADALWELEGHPLDRPLDPFALGTVATAIGDSVRGVAIAVGSTCPREDDDAAKLATVFAGWVWSQARALALAHEDERIDVLVGSVLRQVDGACRAAGEDGIPFDAADVGRVTLAAWWDREAEKAVADALEPDSARVLGETCDACGLFACTCPEGEDLDDPAPVRSGGAP
ncbi:MAG: hypothetical protein IT372_02155 [Polyangiaceae bacterium]|nr:hypothetical protein [Polyangiaceae bacterium]